MHSLMALRSTDILTQTPQELYCPLGDFHIDPIRPVPRALITHGHSDHARSGHGAVHGHLRDLADHGRALRGGLRRIEQEARLGERIRIGDVTVRFSPAGHVLGSAQIAIEAGGTRVVVSGDYKREADPTCAALRGGALRRVHHRGHVRAAGLPPPGGAQRGPEASRIRVALFPERAHIVGAYSLGKAQRVMALLREEGFDQPIYLHGAMERLTEFYKSEGIVLGETPKVVATERGKLGGAIVLCPPSATQDLWSRRFPDPVTCFASGWMRVRARARQKGVELPLIISDHADWDDLCRTILDTGAGEVWVTHGQEDALVHWCTTKGLQARPLHMLGYGDEGEAEEAEEEGGTAPDSADAPRPKRARSKASGPPRQGFGGRRMNRFAALMDRLVYEPRRNAKLRLLMDYFRHTPDPDRGWALAAMTDALMFKEAKPNLIRGLAEERVDPVLFRMSYHYVGDLAEATALIWPSPPLPDGHGGIGHNNPPPHVPTLTEVVEALATLSKSDLPARLAAWLDALDETGRWALLKLITRELRIGVSARLAKTAVAQLGGVETDEVELIWHGLEPPYEDLFAWVEGAGRSPNPATRPRFARRCCRIRSKTRISNARPGRLSRRMEMGRHPAAGRRRARGRRTALKRIYSRTGEDVSRAFPDLVEALDFEGAIDGELLIVRDGLVQSFNVLQQRLNRKAVTAEARRRVPGAPAHIRHSRRRRGGPARPSVLRTAPAPRGVCGQARRPAHRPLADDPLRVLGRVGRGPSRSHLGRGRTGCGRDRGLHAEAGGEPLPARTAQGPLVQVEARPLSRGRGHDVRPARPRKAFVVLLGLHLRGLARRAGRRRTGPGRQGLSRLHRRGAA